MPFLLISGKGYRGAWARSRRRRPFGVCWFLAKTFQEPRAPSTRRRPFGGSADFWQRHTRNCVRGPVDGVLSVSTTFWQRLTRAVCEAWVGPYVHRSPTDVSALTASSQKPRETLMGTTIYKTPPLMSPLYFWQRLTSECTRSPGCDCPLPVNVYLRRTVTSW